MWMLWGVWIEEGVCWKSHAVRPVGVGMRKRKGKRLTVISMPNREVREISEGDVQSEKEDGGWEEEPGWRWSVREQNFEQCKNGVEDVNGDVGVG